MPRRRLFAIFADCGLILLDEAVPVVVFLTGFLDSVVPVVFILFNLFLQEPPEDDANIIEKILASKTVQEVSGSCL